MFFPKYYRMSCDIIIRSMSCCCCCYITLVVSNSVRPHRRQPTRIPRPWDCPGKNTGAGCHFLLQCRKVKSESEVTQSCPTLSDPMDYSLPGYSASTKSSFKDFLSCTKPFHLNLPPFQVYPPLSTCMPTWGNVDG